MQRRSDTPDHAAHQLATRGAGIDNMSGCKRADDAWHANFAGARVDTHFDEFGTESKLDSIFQSRSAGNIDLALIEILQCCWGNAIRSPLAIFFDCADVEPLEALRQINMVDAESAHRQFGANGFTGLANTHGGTCRRV